MLKSALLLLILVTLSNAQELNTTIIKLFEFARHGARAPEQGNFSFFGQLQCCDTVNFTNVWPMGPGGLTLIGAAQHQANGRNIKSRYQASTALPTSLNGQVGFLAAPDCQRCVDSLTNQTIGIWGNSTTVPLTDIQTDAFWWKQKATCPPIAYNVFDNVDSGLYTSFSAGSKSTLLQACLNSTQNATCNAVANTTGLVQGFGIPYCSDNVYSAWYYQSSNGTGQGNELPKWMKDDTIKACVDSLNIGQYYLIYHNASQPSIKNNSLPIGSQFMIGNFLQTLSVYFSDNAPYAQAPAPNNNFALPKGIKLATPTDPGTTFVLTVGHESQVAAILTAMSNFGEYNYVQPPFASFIMFELHQNNANASDKYVRASYRYQLYNNQQVVQDLLTMPFCPNATVTNGYLCPLPVFVNYMKTMFVADAAAETALCASFTKTGTTTSTMTVPTRTSGVSKGLVIGLVLFVALF